MSLARRVAVVVAAALTVGACAVSADMSDPAPVTTAAVHRMPAHSTSPRPVLASTLLGQLTVHAHSSATSYKRSRFTLWIDANGDGANTRAQVLIRQSSISVRMNSHHTVLTGRWVSPYDGRVYTSATSLQIDHVVPLENAWISGAAAWSAAKREAYANDLGYRPSLVAVTGALNEKKGDDDPSGFLPPSTSDRCTYVEAWIGIKTRWHLDVTSAEKAALRADLGTYCTGATRWMTAPPAPDIAALLGRAAAHPKPVAEPSAPASSAGVPSASAKPTGSSAPVESPAPSTSGSSGTDVVHAGSFCSPAGATGVTSAGTPMHCAVASDGRLRWKSAA